MEEKYMQAVLDACDQMNEELVKIGSDDHCAPDTDLTMLMVNHGWFNTTVEDQVYRLCRELYSAGFNYAYTQSRGDVDFDKAPSPDSYNTSVFPTFMEAWLSGSSDFETKCLKDLGKAKNMSFEFTGEEKTIEDDAGHQIKVHRIRAIRAIEPGVKPGQLGGWLERASNLRDEAWVDDEAYIIGNAEAKGHARVFDEAHISGHAVIGGTAAVTGYAEVMEYATVGGDARVTGHALVTDNATVKGHAVVGEYAKITGSATVKDHAAVDGRVYIGGHAVISEDAAVAEQASVVCNAQVFGSAIVRGDAYIEDDARILGNAEVYGSVTIQGRVILDGSASVTGVNVKIGGNAKIKREEDYLLMHNNWSSGRDFAYTHSDGMWHVGCFHGTSEELIAKAYNDYEAKGKCYEAAVNFMKARYAVNEDLPEYKSEEPVDSPRKCCKIKEEVYLE